MSLPNLALIAQNYVAYTLNNVAIVFRLVTFIVYAFKIIPVKDYFKKHYLEK